MNKKIFITCLLVVYAGLSAFISGTLSQALGQYVRWLKDGAHGMYNISISLYPAVLLSHLFSGPGAVALSGCVVLAAYLYLKYRNRPSQDGRKFDIKIISSLLGHKDVTTTYNIYVHFIDNMVDDSVQILNADIPEQLPEKSKKQKNNISELKKAK